MTPDTVTPETTLAIALTTEESPTGIQPSTDDLAVAAAEPATEVQGADAVSAMAPVDEAAVIIEPNVATSDAAAPEKVQSAPTSKCKSRVKKRKTEVPGTLRRPDNSRSKNGAGESDAGTAEVSSQAENVASFPQK